MEKAKKKQIKKYITWVTMAAVVAALTLMPLLAGSAQEAAGPKASILSGSVKRGSLTTALYGGGTLSAENAAEIRLPNGVKITEFLVSNGQYVKTGDPLAVIDKVSLMAAITGVQDTMDYLVEEMAKVSSQQETTWISARAGGRIKQIFAQKGDDVQDVMLAHGALAVISLDGRMAVDIPCTTSLSTGDPVSVVIEGSEIPGRVESNMGGILVVTVEDPGYPVGQSVAVSDTEGNPIGSGALYVHNAWRAVAYSGTVDAVYGKEETDAYAGQVLLTVTDSGINARKESLASQHREYENLMLTLFRLYQTDTLNAPCDGMVDGVDENSIHLLSGNENAWKLQFLANAPGANTDGVFDNHVGQYIGALGSQWIVRMNPQSQEITDYKDAADTLDLSTENMTYETMMDPVTVYKLVDGEWEISEPNPGDILIFALGDGGFVWTVQVEMPEEEPSEPSDPPTEPDEDPTKPDPTEPEEPTKPEDPENPDEEDPDDDEPGFPDMDDLIGGIIGGVPQEPEYELYSLEDNLLLSVIPQEEMKLNIQLDERDIAKVTVGMTAEVTVSALHNERYSAVITAIGDTGTNLGGSSQFTVELTLQAADRMLPGMTATASIPLSTAEDVLLIPVEALVEENGSTLIYTGYDEKTDTLVNPVAVTLGRSDGIHAEVLSGLSLSDTFWYSYYDTLEIDHSVEEPGFSF